MSMLYKDNLIFVKIKIQHHVCVKQAIMTDKKSNLISLCIPRSGEKWNIYMICLRSVYILAIVQRILKNTIQMFAMEANTIFTLRMVQIKQCVASQNNNCLLGSPGYYQIKFT